MKKLKTKKQIQKETRFIHLVNSFFMGGVITASTLFAYHNLPFSEGERAVWVLEGYKHRLEELQAVAVLDPTRSNIEAYLEYDKQLMEMDSLYRRTEWKVRYSFDNHHKLTEEQLTEINKYDNKAEGLILSEMARHEKQEMNDEPFSYINMEEIGSLLTGLSKFQLEAASDGNSILLHSAFLPKPKLAKVLIGKGIRAENDVSFLMKLFGLNKILSNRSTTIIGIADYYMSYHKIDLQGQQNLITPSLSDNGFSEEEIQKIKSILTRGTQ